jgi:hypothetical protein
MRLVKFPLVKEGNLIIYPDDITLFSNTTVEGAFVTGEYAGELPLDDYVLKNIGSKQMSGLAFMNLVGDANMVQLLILSKTDPVCELLVKKLDRAEIIDFDDAERGPQVGMQHLLSINALSQSEYDRIVRREFL